MTQLALNYFDTTHLPPAALGAAIRQAERQDDAILAIFQQYGTLSPSRCWEILIAHTGDNTPLTSVRRSISTLTDAGKLTMLDEQVKGIFGKPQHLWRLTDSP